jgi:hypothetical protein
MAYNPELVELLLGKYVAKLFDGTIKVTPADDKLMYGSLKVGDTLSFKFKNDKSVPLRQFIVKQGKS